MGEWKHGTCGCFDNCGICILAYFCPCIVFGQAAEKVGESCCLCGCLYFVPIGNIIGFLNIRGKIRESHDIDGSCCNDFLMLLFCGFCALVQMGQEVEGDPTAQGISMVRE